MDETEKKKQVRTSTGQIIVLQQAKGFQLYIQQKKSILFQLLNLLIENDEMPSMKDIYQDVIFDFLQMLKYSFNGKIIHFWKCKPVTDSLTWIFFWIEPVK